MLMVAEITFKQIVMDSFILFGVLVQPVIIAFLALWMLRDRMGDYIIFIIVGSGLTGLWSSLLFVGGNSINVERWSGTLESLVGMPTSLSVIVLGKNLANVIQSLGSMIVSYVLIAWVFGYHVTIEQPLPFLVSMLLTVIAFISFGLVLAPIFVINPGVASFQNALEFPVYILAGFLFPALMLPGWTKPLSYLLPPYWSAMALHGTSSGNLPFNQILFYWGMLILFSVVDLILATQLFKIMLVKARHDATLDME
jgi:ABC-2 type transport system permease protein